ncbi:hypothetical protein AG0111_0g9393 [Alternaria gaisen]|uniref:Uncharacterized protein n=1 Tax=Alternaria gaisen TaxID=167740 RepID=A0ACB6FF00_9PLEO|nr:hypothetical protein AG0111_0g9393 [Alternaria gaisen]
MTTAGPLHVIETAHPAHRGVITGLYNTFWFVGSLLQPVSHVEPQILQATSPEDSVWLQMLFPALLVILSLSSLRVPRCIWVSMQIREYEEYSTWMEVTNAGGTTALFQDSSRALPSRMQLYRCYLGQWAGNGAVDYFISGVLESAGVTDEIKKMNINLGKSCMQLAFVARRSRVDKLGRRPMPIGTFDCNRYLGWSYRRGLLSEQTNSIPAGNAFVALVFLFNAVFAFGITPAQALYPVEVLSFEIRAKGMAFSNLSLTTAMLINQFAHPIALEKIG